MSGPFPARRPGWCQHPECGRRFGQGDVIAYHREPGERRSVLMHEACARGHVAPHADDLTLRDNETVCPHCQLVHQGECP